MAVKATDNSKGAAHKNRRHGDNQTDGDPLAR
jgi:hypothetical protein